MSSALFAEISVAQSLSSARRGSKLRAQSLSSVFRGSKLRAQSLSSVFRGSGGGAQSLSSARRGSKPRAQSLSSTFSSPSVSLYIIYNTRARGRLLRQVERDAVEVTSACIDSTQRHRVCSRAAPHEFLTCLFTCPVAVIFKVYTLIIDYLDLAKLHA